MSQGLSDLYTGLETDLIANIAEYLQNGDIYSSTAQWKIQMLAQLGALDKANIRTISGYAGISPALLSQALETASLTAINELEGGFRQLVKDGIINGTDVPVEDTMAKALAAYSKQAKNSLNMVNTVMLYKAKSITGKIINRVAEIADKPEYIAMLNKAAGKVVTGIESRQSAMRQCIQEMTDKGIPAFVDKLGREWSPEAYVNMNIRTTLSNTANTAQMERMNDYGINLVEVSSHSGARPKCAKYQGRIFDKSNKSEKYPHWKDTSYGQPDGLLGINCGHQIYPYIEGISIQRYFPYDKKENDKAYKLSQHQRELERRVRKSKRECMVLEKLGDKEGLKRASATLKNRKQALTKFSADNNLPVRTDRTAVVGYNKSIAGKTKLQSKLTIHQNTSFDTNFKANKKVIENKTYFQNYKGITSNSIGDMQVMKYAKKSIYANDGLETEDIYLLKAFSGRFINHQKTGAYGGVLDIDIEKYKPNSLVLVHNHPNSSAFSFSDFVTMNDFPQIKTMIAAGHDGTVYKMSVGNGKRLDLSDEREYTVVENQWNRLCKTGLTNAIKEFTQMLGWDFK